MKFRIRAAKKNDCKDISRLIMVRPYDKTVMIHVQDIQDQKAIALASVFNGSKELAVYEKMAEQVKITQTDLERDGFSPDPFYECLVAELTEDNKTSEGYSIVGYALYFFTYSTWKGRSVYMEDLYVMPEFRGKGIGKGLMSKVAQVGKEKECVRLQLSVLDWNTPSLDFYVAKGAKDLTQSEGWHAIRFDGQALEDLAKEASTD